MEKYKLDPQMKHNTWAMLSMWYGQKGNEKHSEESRLVLIGELNTNNRNNSEYKLKENNRIS